MIYFCSDLHFGHKNIVKYCNRPFADVDDMNEKLIQNWNDVVAPTDSVYILGDLTFAKPEKTVEILDRLNGSKYLILGNHDSRVRKDENIKSRFVWCRDSYNLDCGDRERVVLNHFPMAVWDRSHHGAIHLHGHCHGKFKDPSLENSDPTLFGASTQRCDVGVDCWDYRPVTLAQIKERMARAPKHLQYDEHNEKTNR